MHISHQKSRLHLILSAAEAELLMRALKSLHKNYQVKPDELDSEGAGVWYSTRGCETAGMNAAETKEWLANLFQFRSEVLGLISDWIGQLEGQEGQRCKLVLTVAQGPTLLRALNDHRLLLAARHGLGEAELASRTPKTLKALKPEQKGVILEIDILALIMEAILWHLPNSGADWRE